MWLVALYLLITSFQQVATQDSEITDRYGLEANDFPDVNMVEENYISNNVKDMEKTGLSRDNIQQQTSLIMKIYNLFAEFIKMIITAPKINNVIRNIGTCVVNGAMDLADYYLPAMVMPILATAAGALIPPEPVAMLKEMMPMSSYRRAFQFAMNSFMHTLDKFKTYLKDDDPYMVRRFNRRFSIGNSAEKQMTRKTYHSPNIKID